MEARTFGKDAYKRLKRRTDKLIEACGGLVTAAHETRAGKSSLANYADSRDHGAAANMWAPIDVIADLERAAGEPLVTRELARLAGYDLLPMPTMAGALDPLSDHCHHAILMGRATEAALIMDEDGVRTRAELTDYVGKLSEARDYLQLMLDKARTEQAASNVTDLRVAS
jgi:hypothetical protein